MKFDDLIIEIERLNIANEIFGFPERINFRSSETEKLHKQNFRAHLPSKNEKTNNGIYCFLNENKEILYIGKASSNNIAQEMFKKIPLPVVVDKEIDIATFEKNYWTGKNLPESAKECIANGNFFIGFVLLESSDIASKLEIYLQVIYAKQNNGNFPPLNSRIG